MRPFDKAESPIVGSTLHKRHSVIRSRQASIWALVNLVLAALLYIELFYGPVVPALSSLHPFVWYLELGVCSVLVVCSVWQAFTYIGLTLTATPVELTVIQKKLLGVKGSEPGFKTWTPKPQSPRVSDVGPSYSQSGFHTSHNSSFSPMASPNFSLNPASPYSPSASMRPLSMTPSPGRLSSPGSATPSPHGSGSRVTLYGGQGSGMVRSGHDGSYMSPSFLGGNIFDQSSFAGTPVTSLSMSRVGTGSPTYNLSPLFHEADTPTGLRSRFQNSSLKASPLRSDEVIADHRSLDKFLHEQMEKDRKLQAVSQESSPGGSTSFWNYNRSFSDYSPLLRKYQYQIACRSPQQAKSKETDTDEPTTYSADEVWNKVNVDQIQVDRWLENLRKWLCQTVVVRLVEEINKINNNLASIGSEDMQIGDVNISTLKQLAVTKGPHVPTLHSVIPFLEVTANQEYLVHRIRDLGSGGCMSAYKWNGGGDYRGKKWSEHLPTDAAILIHMLCTYMDSRLPPHPKYPDGKTFTTQHFLHTPDKPNLEKKDNLFIYQTKINPPHFAVVLGNDIWNIQKGRSNFFHAVLRFLHHIRDKEHGMLGRVNLGMSGINILWVVDP